MLRGLAQIRLSDPAGPHPNLVDGGGGRAVVFRPSWGCSSAGRALQSHCRGQGFDPPQLHRKLGAWSWELGAKLLAPSVSDLFQGGLALTEKIPTPDFRLQLCPLV